MNSETQNVYPSLSVEFPRACDSRKPGMSWKEKWIPRLFMVAMVPSIAMIVALLWFPQSEIAKCPLLVQQAGTVTSGQSTFSLNINGAKFPIANANVLPAPLSSEGDVLVFLGVVLDVTSGVAFYGPDGGYHALACGKDATRALLLSSLDEMDMIEDISDQPKGALREKLRQWLSFFLNKYPQLGVVEGIYWDSTGGPTPALLELAHLVSGEPSQPVKVTMKPCVTAADNSRSCASQRLVPKIKRQRGNSECVCVDENKVFSEKTEEFVIIHFEDCDPGHRVCRPENFEL